MSEAVTIQHELTADEDLALRRAIHAAQVMRKPMLWFSVFCFGLGVLTGVAEGLKYGLIDGVMTLLPWSLIGGVWMTYATVPFSFWSRHARVVGKHERTLDETGLHIRAGHVTIDLPWHAMTRTIETPEFFLFFDAKAQAHYLPKRGLRDREHRALQQLIAARSPESVRRLGP